MRKTISLILAVLLCAALIPAIESTVQAQVKPAWTVPSGYNEHDYNCCAAFLEQTNSDGITNGSQYSSNYDVNDPETWGSYWHLDGDGFTRLYPRFDFRLVNGELRIRKIWLEEDATLHVAGNFDFPNCTALEEVDAGWGGYNDCYHSFDLSGDTSLLYLKAGGNGKETQLNVSGCTSLRFLDFCGFDMPEMDLSDCESLMYLACSYNTFTQLDLTHNTALKELLCEMTPLTRINLSNCPELEFIRLKDNMLTAIDLSNNPLLPLDGVYADGKGTVGYYYEEMEEGPWTCVFENPVDGETFLGWYNLEDELLSEDEYFNIADIADTVLIAKFTGAFQILPGDVDGDGEVTVADALLALRASMGLIELDNAQWAAANVDGDEEVTVADALLILRASMGLLEL